MKHRAKKVINLVLPLLAGAITYYFFPTTYILIGVIVVGMYLYGYFTYNIGFDEGVYMGIASTSKRWSQGIKSQLGAIPNFNTLPKGNKSIKEEWDA